MNYYENNAFISNSDLGSFKDVLQGEKNLIPDEKLQAIYDFGNLVEHYALPSSDSADRIGSPSDVEKAKLMAQAVESNPSARFLISLMGNRQHEFYRNADTVEWEGVEVQIPRKCKFDGYSKKFKIGIDLKTTACLTLQEFIVAFWFFDYDRQAAWYMDIARIDRMVYIGVSKKLNRFGRHEVFIHAIERGDAFYQSGLKKYSKLAIKYYFMVQSLNTYL
jgi:hypothetical protein